MLHLRRAAIVAVQGVGAEGLGSLGTRVAESDAGIACVESLSALPSKSGIQNSLFAHTNSLIFENKFPVRSCWRLVGKITELS
jgi:hypothetical protein